MISSYGLVLLPQSGAYTLEVSGFGGTYPVQLIDLTTATGLSLDTEVNVTLESLPNSLRASSFHGIAGRQMIRQISDHNQVISPFSVVFHTPSGTNQSSRDPF